MPILRRLEIRPRPFYNTRHTYITCMLEVGAKPLRVCRQTGTSLEMIEEHYGKANIVADKLDSLIGEATERAAERRNTALQKRNLPGTFDNDEDEADDA